MSHNITRNQSSTSRKDIHQHVTDTIIAQLEAGTVPWQQPWINNKRMKLQLPRNYATNKTYRGINIVLLWSAAIEKHYESAEWASFKQWADKKEIVRKGEKGNLIVYYDTFDKEIDGEFVKVPFLKQSYVFNRCQLNSYEPQQEIEPAISLVQRLDHVEQFVSNTKAIIEHQDGGAFYNPVEDKIYMPLQETFIDSNNCTATESYYSVLFHELTHWTGHESRINREIKNKFGSKAYAQEELTAELGAAFLSAKMDISMDVKNQHACYIANWLEVLKKDKSCVLRAASDASRAINFLDTSLG